MNDLGKEVSENITGRITLNTKGKNQDYSQGIYEEEHPDSPLEDEKYVEEHPWTDEID